MLQLLAKVSLFPLKLFGKLVAWRWKKTRAAWRVAWREPARPLRFLYLVLGLFIANALVPVAFSQLGTIGGFPYLFAVLLAISSATFFRTVKVRRVTYVPLGLTCPIPRTGRRGRLPSRQAPTWRCEERGIGRGLYRCGHHSGRLRPHGTVVQTTTERESLLTLL